MRTLRAGDGVAVGVGVGEATGVGEIVGVGDSCANAEQSNANNKNERAIAKESRNWVV